ncbi:MAG: prepilin-type N-terminal cleavage/methylation domain-containing protein [Leptothrix sp. (in: b-proteobacteria)]
MQRVQQGVTLIELMMVALTVSILMTVAMPVYQGYLVQARKNAAMFACAVNRSANMAALQSGAELPAANASGCAQELP